MSSVPVAPDPHSGPGRAKRAKKTPATNCGLRWDIKGGARGWFLLLALAAGCSRQPSGEMPKAEYNPETGRLQRLAFDANRNGRNDSVSVMDGSRIRRIELDLDENGQVERWDFYGSDGKIEKVGFASRNDGVMDSQAFYAADGTLQRIELSTRRNGRFDRIEFYEAGVLVRSEEDQNGDGRPDKWETYRPEPNAARGEPGYVITSAAFDDEGRGTPQRRFIYGPDGRIARVEIDPEGDGTFVARPVKGSALDIPAEPLPGPQCFLWRAPSTGTA